MAKRIIFLLCISSLILNCEDKETKTKKSQKTEDTETKKEVVINEEPFETLDSKSAMFFFQEYAKKHKENKVRISTDFGTMDVLLFDETPFHRANFIFLTKQNYFNDTQFYRVIDNFIIQGGNSDDKKTAVKRSKIGEYLLPTDTKHGFKHDRGVLSMPSSEIENPHKLASPFEFFIVTQQGGAHYLNGNYTIFGKVIKGMDVADKIAAVETDESDWPHQNVFIRKVEIIK